MQGWQRKGEKFWVSCLGGHRRGCVMLGLLSTPTMPQGCHRGFRVMPLQTHVPLPMNHQLCSYDGLTGCPSSVQAVAMLVLPFLRCVHAVLLTLLDECSCCAAEEYELKLVSCLSNFLLDRFSVCVTTILSELFSVAHVWNWLLKKLHILCYIVWPYGNSNTYLFFSSMLCKDTVSC